MSQRININQELIFIILQYFLKMISDYSKDWINIIKFRLEKILKDNIISFWYPNVIDYEFGGYNLSYDIENKSISNGPKMIVSQARMLWFFSKIYKVKFKNKRFLRAADHGFTFLKEVMWDKKYGGFFWELDPTTKILKPKKHLYGQAFALIALLEYSKVCINDEPLKLAKKLFIILEKNAHDIDNNGYLEYFNQDWSIPPKDEIGYLGFNHDAKLLNTHIHILEALNYYYRATEDTLAKERLIEMMFILSNTIIDKKSGTCIENFTLDWIPLKIKENERRVYFGHNIKISSVIYTSCKTLNLSNKIFLDFLTHLFSPLIRYGFDSKRGGFYDSGKVFQSADHLNKIWWVQAEGLISLLIMYEITNDEKYLEYFIRTLNWIENYQIDWDNGEWFNEITPKGNPIGPKVNIWKAGYHTTKAILEVLNLKLFHEKDKAMHYIKNK